MAIQRMVVAFAAKDDHFIIEVSGKWISRMFDELIKNSDDPREISLYGIQVDTAPEFGLWIWEGDLEDIDFDEGSLIFKGTWRKPTDPEIEAMRRGWRIWPVGFEKMTRLERLTSELAHIAARVKSSPPSFYDEDRGGEAEQLKKEIDGLKKPEIAAMPEAAQEAPARGRAK